MSLSATTEMCIRDRRDRDRDSLTHLIVRKTPMESSYQSMRNEAVDFPVVAVAAAKRQERLFVSVGARPSRAKLVEAAAGESAGELAARFTYGTNARASAEYRLSLIHIYKSPNSAHTEAVCAGALGIRLAGPASYFGKMVEKPYIGDALRPVEDEDIVRANRLLSGAYFLAAAVFAAARLMVF